MPSYKVSRTSEDMKRELSAILRELKDPRTQGMLSIVKLDLASDYSFCKVYVSAMEGMDYAKEAVRALEGAAGFIRRELGRRMTVHHVPQLKFVADDSIAYSAEISQKLRDLGQ